MKKYKSKIYLLKIDTDDKRLYKIGSTRNSIQKRIKSLQTGCPYEIKLVDYYESNYGQLIERTIHNNYSYMKTHGEWFQLDIKYECDFINLCEKIEKLNENLEKNKLD